MARKKKTLEFVMEQATTDKGMGNSDRVNFHYFNPNGLGAEKKDLDDQIRLLVDAGRVPSGWHIAYGTFNDFHAAQLRKLVRRRKGLGNIETQVTIEGLRRECEKIREQIKTVSL